jgi:predicted phosphodiesterase
MTLFALLADIHANRAALDAVLDDMAARGIERLLVAGDMVTGSPQPHETLRRLVDQGAKMIRGNNEEYVLRFTSPLARPPWALSKQWAVTQWTCQQLDEPDLCLLRALPAQQVVAGPSGDAICLVHGSPRSSTEMLFPFDPGQLAPHRRAGQHPTPEPLERALCDLDEQVLVCAHSHIPWVQRTPQHLVVNPGSVGIPVNGDPRAQYALLRAEAGRWDAQLCAVPYDQDATRRAFLERGLLHQGGGLARALLPGIETGKNTCWFLVCHAYRLADKRGLGQCPALPDALWDEAVDSFDWPANAFSAD